MGAGLSHAASGVGAFLGNLVTAPLKSLFGGSCDDICAGPWDVGCFIDHLCVSNLLKFVLILALCYIILVFLYLLFKIGICQCVIKSLCKMCWAGFATYCYALHDTTCCIWHKMMRVRHANRRRRRMRKMRRRVQDIERGGDDGGYDVDGTSTTSSSLSSAAGPGSHSGGGVGVRKRKSVRMREDGWRTRGVAAFRRRKSFPRRNGRGIRVRSTTAKDVSAAAASLSSRRRLRSSRRRVQLIRGNKKKPAGKNGVGSFKRRRLR